MYECSQIAFGLQKNSELRPLLDHHILKLIESGAVSHLRHKWLRRRAPKLERREEKEEGEGALALGYDNLMFPALALLAGIAGGLVSVAAEVKFGGRKKKGRR